MMTTQYKRNMVKNSTLTNMSVNRIDSTKS